MEIGIIIHWDTTHKSKYSRALYQIQYMDPESMIEKYPKKYTWGEK